MTELHVAIDDYINYKVAEGGKKSTLDDVRYRLRAIMRDIGAERWQDIREEDVTNWFTDRAAIQTDTGLSKLAPNTRRLNWKYLHQFFRWAVVLKYLPENPADNAPRPKNFKRDRRKLRRSMTEVELEKLVKVAKLRPLAEYCKTRMIGSRHTDYWQQNPITWDNLEAMADYARQMKNSRRSIDRLSQDGEKWSLAYRLLVLTGLRWGELSSLKVGRIDLDERTILLDSNATKNGNSDLLPLPAELVADLRDWITKMKLSSDDLLLNMPRTGVKRFYRDLEVAGIPRVDARGYELDIHALRYSFGTMLARNCVPVAVAMKLMRHSKPELTIGLYTDANVLDYRGASDSLPALGANKEPVVEPVKEESIAAAPASPIPSANDGLLKALLETADAETLRAALLKSMGQ
jgi:integrase